MNANKALWEKGDFTRIAASMRESGDALVESLGIGNGMKVLDLGCGDGNTAIPAAKRGADVAKEMYRAARPGGRVFMGNWIPNDPTLVAQILRISSAYSPPPPEGFISPMTWGVEEHVIERFTAAGAAAENISFERDIFTFRFDGTPAAFVETFRCYYGPTMNAFDAAAANGKEEQLAAELTELFEKENRGNGTGKTVIPATYLRLRVIRSD